MNGRHPVIGLLARKLSQAVLTVLLVTAGTSELINLVPGSAASLILGVGATPEAIKTLNRELGLDQSFWVRYYHWLFNAVHGNLGTSIQTSEPVAHLLATHFPVTFEIAFVSLFLSICLAIPCAMWSAARSDRLADRVIRGVSSGLLAAPPFVSCVVLAVIFSVELRWLPSFGWVPLTQSFGENLLHAALAIIVLVLAVTPVFVRILRADLVTVMGEDYILAVRAKGIPDRHILFRHALRPASFSLLTVAGLVFGFLIGGSIILENYFTLPGLGLAVGQAVQGKDVAVVQGVVVVMTVVYVLINTIVDLTYMLLDPRLRVA